MLHIVRQDIDARRIALVLHGRIVGGWAEVLEHESREAILAGFRVVLALTGVVYIGRSGVETLRRLAASGVEIIGCSPLIADMLEHEGIDVERNPGDASDASVPGIGGGSAGA